MNARAQSQCTPSCLLYRSPFSAENTTGLPGPFCVAFPTGIPDDVWENRFDHRNVHPDQVGTAVWTAAGPDTVFPTYALAVEPTLTAAADVMEGAMIALVPSPADLQRLVIPGGEPVEQLHLTLLYLGEAADIDQEARDELIAWARDLAPPWDSVDAEGFAPALFNPNGDEPCMTLLCMGADLAEMHETATADVTDIIDLPEDLHQPWIPHVTLAYLPAGEDPGLIDMGPDGGLDVARRCGPIVFDRIRLAFGGEVTDVPLGSAVEAAPAESSTETPPDAAAVVVAASPSADREVWDGPLH